MGLLLASAVVDPNPADFWPMAATTLPVLGLALLLETRWMLSPPGEETLGRQRSMLLLINGLSLCAVGVGAYAAVGATASGSGSLLWRTVIAVAFSLSITSLIITPGLMVIMHIAAHPMATLVSSRWGLSMSARRAVAGWQLRRAEADLRRQSLRLYDVAVKTHRTVGLAEAHLARAERYRAQQPGEEADALVGEALDAVAMARESAAEVRDLGRSAEVRWAGLQGLRDRLRQWHDADVAFRREFVDGAEAEIREGVRRVVAQDLSRLEGRAGPLAERNGDVAG